eukprot:gene3521-6139_t
MSSGGGRLGRSSGCDGSSTERLVNTRCYKNGLDGRPAKPSVELCGVSTRVASDDFSVFCIPSLTVSIGLTVTAVLLLVAVVQGVCNKTARATAFATCWTVTASLGLIVDVLLSIYSSCGTISNDKPRRKAVPILVAGSIVIDLVQIGVMIFAASLFFTNSLECDTQEEKWKNKSILEAVTYIGFIFAIMRFLRLAFLFRSFMCCCRAINQKETESIYGTLPSSHSSSCSIFLLRCICCSPCLKVHESDSKNDIWLELSHVMSQVFGNEMYTWTDLVAALCIVQASHKQQRRSLVLSKLRQSKSTAGNVGNVSANTNNYPCSFQSLSSAEDLAILGDAMRMFDFACAVFSWPMDCYMHGPFSTCSKMCGACTSTSCAADVSKYLQGDCCRLSALSVLSQINIQPESIIELDFRSNICQQPFFVAIDQQKM